MEIFSSPSKICTKRNGDNVLWWRFHVRIIQQCNSVKNYLSAFFTRLLWSGWPQALQVNRKVFITIRTLECWEAHGSSPSKQHVYDLKDELNQTILNFGDRCYNWKREIKLAQINLSQVWILYNEIKGFGG